MAYRVKIKSNIFIMTKNVYYNNFLTPILFKKKLAWRAKTAKGAVLRG